MSGSTEIGKLKLIRASQKSNGRCWYCGSDFSTQTVTVDHIIPKKHGGTNDLSNLVIACKSCNSSKRSRTLEEFRDWKSSGQLPCERFTRSQLEFLESLGYDMSLLDPEPVVFFGEVCVSSIKGAQND